ncbi:MAG: TIGR04282 family arsenosugar biosynthesis glycosyltransferase [Oleispira sp.]|nr:TIGR04282 family arsenosugar biosynthesis glycosyltransferase [Oleispira sp.]MBL4880534.1 TIGR04282 family arsenosugar biosynthesis glycosyltransferase [Oleispira sp.]
MENKVEWIVLTKAPVPGLVKTRLIPALGEQAACAVYEQLLARLLGSLKQVTVSSGSGVMPSRIALWIAGDAEHEAFKPWLALAEQVTFYQQPSGTDTGVDKDADKGKADLGERMALAVQSSLSRGYIPVLIGVDVPDLDETYLLNCLQQLRNHDLVISPAEDGGYGLLGMKQFYAELFVNKAWSTDTVFESTKADIERLDIMAKYLPKVWDVDESADVERFRKLTVL